MFNVQQVIWQQYPEQSEILVIFGEKKKKIPPPSNLQPYSEETVHYL